MARMCTPYSLAPDSPARRAAYRMSHWSAADQHHVAFPTPGAIPR